MVSGRWPSSIVLHQCPTVDESGENTLLPVFLIHATAIYHIAVSNVGAIEGRTCTPCNCIVES